MTKRSEWGPIIILLFLISFLFSCQPDIRRETVMREPERIAIPILPSSVIEDRISILEDLLANDKIDKDDREMVLNLLSGYRRIASVPRSDIPDSQYREVIQILLC